MPLDDAFGMMPRFARELLNERRDPAHEDHEAQLLAAAHAHGAFRRAQLCGLAALEYEFDLLIVALREELRSGGLSDALIRDTLLIVTAQITIAREAGVGGWHNVALS
jgi:hypothetical protein